MPKLAFYNCEDYSPARVEKAVGGILSAYPGFLERVKPGVKVLIKPNLLIAREPEKAVTTHPALVRAVATEMIKRGAKVYIGDSPGGRSTSESIKEVFRKTGMLEVCEQTGADPAYFEDEGTEVRLETGVLYKSFPLVKIVKEADLIISMPKLKTHGFMILTMAVKNNFGCVPGFNKPLFHIKVPDRLHFSEMLCDLALLVKPDLTIIDAVVGMEGDGPSSGNPRFLGFLAAGDDQFVLDWELTRILGLNPLLVPVNKTAQRRGLIPSRDKVEWAGEESGKFQVKDFELPAGGLADKIPGFLLKFAKNSFIPKPKVNRKICIGCKICLENCYSAAIKWDEDYPVFDYDKCIRCYCCHELCPESAIELSISRFMGKLVYGRLSK